MLAINRILRTAAKFPVISNNPSKALLTRTFATTMAAKTGNVPYAQLAGRVKPQLLKALESMEITHMSPVQEKVLSLPTFTQDCLVQAKTGTGKTIAFLLPALQNLLEVKDLDRSYVSLLVLAPTRELAQQIAEECTKLTSQCNPAFECHIAVGGAKKASTLNKFLKGKPTVLVATPGRLNDYLSEQGPRDKLSRVRCVVLDEADRMLDEGFMPDVVRILSQIPPKAEAGWQGMCFSATVPPEINKVLHLVLKPGHARISTIDKNEAPTVELVPQKVYPVQSVEEVLPTLHSVLACAKADNPTLKAVIFCPTARHAALMYHLFGHTGGAAPPKLPVFQMQSRMTQAARTRTIEEFKQTDRGLLFASDVVGRGMDFPDINLVVQIGVPSEKDQYVHRVGRTGRAGKVGTAVMITTPQEMWFIKRNPQFPIVNDGPFAHPKASLYPSAKIIETALDKIPEQAKEQAYVANLGFVKSLMKQYSFNTQAVVQYANSFAKSMGCDSPPALQASTVGKMGLKGVPGINVAGRGEGRPPRGGQRGNANTQSTEDRPPAKGGFAGGRGSFTGGRGGFAGGRGGFTGGRGGFAPRAAGGPGNAGAEFSRDDARGPARGGRPQQQQGGNYGRRRGGETQSEEPRPKRQRR